MNKRIIPLIFILFISTFLLVVNGCATKEQRAALRAVEKQAKSNAIAYVKDKYGFDVKVLYSDAHKDLDELFPTNDPTGYATVTVKYNNDRFNVYITGEEESIDGVDDYQKDAILQDFENVVKTTLDDYCSEEMYVDLYCGEKVYADRYIHTYYDGSNLWEVLEEMGGTWGCRVVTKDLNLQSIDIASVYEELEVVSHLFLINCYDMKEYEYLEKISFDSDPVDIKEYACYIDEYYYYSVNDNEYCDFSRVENDGFYVVMVDGTYCNISQGDLIVSNKYKKLFGTYSLETDAETIHIYVDSNKLKSNNYLYMDVLYSQNRNGECIFSGNAVDRYVNSQHLMCSIDEIENGDVITFTVIIEKENY